MAGVAEKQKVEIDPRQNYWSALSARGLTSTQELPAIEHGFRTLGQGAPLQILTRSDNGTYLIIPEDQWKQYSE